MMKTFIVSITAHRTVLVEVQDDEGVKEAYDKVSENCAVFGWEVDRWQVENQIISPEQQIADAKRDGAVEMDDFIMRESRVARRKGGAK